MTFAATVEKMNGAFVVTIPEKDARELGLREGQQIELDVRAIAPRDQLSAEVKAAFDVEFERGRAALKYLAEN